MGMLDRQITDARAWTRDIINPQDCVIPIGKAGLDEVYAMAETIDANPLPTVLRHPDQFEIPVLRAVMDKARTQLSYGTGVAVIDRLPMDDISKDTAVAISWVLGHLVGRPVAQKWDGTMLYDVADTGAQYVYGVRGSYTNVELVFHNDNASGIALPSYVGLLCHYPALEGGLSRFCSIYTLHNLLLENHPEHLERLYQPLIWDRQAEHDAKDVKVTHAPMFAWDGERLTLRANTRLIEKGYEVVGEEMDAATRDAIDVVSEVSAADELWFGLAIERGQIQFLNNIETAHYRSTFVDHDDPALKRHLVRTWHREWGQPTFDG